MILIHILMGYISIGMIVSAYVVWKLGGFASFRDYLIEKEPDLEDDIKSLSLNTLSILISAILVVAWPSVYLYKKGG